LLSPEELKKELEGFRVSGARQELEQRLGSEGADIAEVGRAFLASISPVRDQDKDAQRKRIQRCYAIDSLDERERRRLFYALFPPIANEVEASWLLQRGMPYQSGFQRRAFRSPANPENSLVARVGWLQSLLNTVVPYRYDLSFLATWAPHLGWYAEQPVGVLLAGALSSADEHAAATFEILRSIVNGEHPVARPGRSTVIALVSSPSPDAWTLVERLLLAAQRQEGLRQVVLEAVDFAHPEAFKHMLRLIESEDLVRFAAVARAVAVWFGLTIDSSETRLLEQIVHETCENLENPHLRDERIRTAQGPSLYLALWANAFEDVVSATTTAEQLLGESSFDRRYPAAFLLSEVKIADAAPSLVRCLSDPDLRIALTALRAVPNPAYQRWDQTEFPDIFESLQELFSRMPEDKLLDQAIWSWNQIHAQRSEIASRLITHRGSRPFVQLAPYIPQMDAMGRALLLTSMTAQAVERKLLLREEREIAFSLLSDLSQTVREHAFKLLQHATIAPQEALAIEALLSRKASDLRRGAIRLLLKQDAVNCRASIERLTNSGDPLKLKAAEEIRSELEPATIAAASLTDGLGLFRPEERTPPVHLCSDLNPQICSAAAEALLKSLDQFVDKHRETTITVKTHNEQQVQELLGNLKWFRQGPDFPLQELSREWWNAQSPSTIELARAFSTSTLHSCDYAAEWQKRIVNELVKPVPLKFASHVRAILWHLLESRCTGDDLSLLLNILETLLYRISTAYKPEYEPKRTYSFDSAWRIITATTFINFLRSTCAASPQAWEKQHWQRYWTLLRWFDEGLPSKGRRHPALETTLEAHTLQVASEADVYDQFLGPREKHSSNFQDLKKVTKRKQNKLYADYPWLGEIVRRCRDRVLEVELMRGELPTEASAAALSLSSAFGAELALTVLQNLGLTPLERGYIWSSESKAAVFSHLLRVCLPGPEDTPSGFAEIAARLAIAKKRLIDLALYAPQWATFVEQATGISGLTDAAFWLHAHTKDSQWTVEQEIRELWFAEVSERTPLSREELLDGAVDLDWYHRVRNRLAAKDWDLILDSAKFASGGNGHKRAELFAEAIAGKTKTATLAARIADKRHQDSVRALGLLPLPTAQSRRQKEVLHRYEILQDFLRKSRAFGAQRQASEKLAYSIGLANLARNAGYADPQRLSWAMEAQAIADLTRGPVVINEGPVQATLSINSLGEPELAFAKNGKPLKEAPAAAKMSPAIAELRSRRTQLAQQTSRMRLSLEESMIRGDKFTVAELNEMEKHPMLRPMLSNLAFVDESGMIHWGDQIDALAQTLRIAHPVDLLQSGDWPRHQRVIIEQQWIQPFKQAFRELYLLTEAERGAPDYSPRYSGQQVNPREAIAIAGKRGWVNVPEEGLRKTFHELGVSAWVTFLEGWFTPAEVDGLTVNHILFTGRADGKFVPIDKIEPRIFSEVMRDLDLVVSVAHRGGVDPEATHSTVEMRSALLRETLRLLRLSNVRLDGRHAFVDGQIGSYNVHLGSGIVHRQPGGSLCIIPVHSQHRGRLFLPFADNDPKTAEIVSKVLLLAQDEKIKDPTILEQLR
jgi:hypothetical protein